MKSKTSTYFDVLSEAQIQAQVVAMLHLFGRDDVCWWACPNGDFRHPAVGARLKKQGVRPGAADLMFVIDGVFHGVELKSASGTQQPSQKSFEENLTRARGRYHLCKGLQDTLHCLVDISAFQPKHEEGVLNGNLYKRLAYGARDITAAGSYLRAARYRKNYTRKRVARPRISAG